MYTYQNDFAAYIAARNNGERVEIDEEMFYYWLEVLPPVYMAREIRLPDGQKVHSSFGFAEGAEPVTAFWQYRGKYFCQRTTQMDQG